LAASLSGVHAQTIWTGAVDSDCHTAGNWSAGVPAAGITTNIFALGDVLHITQTATAGTGDRPVLNIAADVTSTRIQVGRDLTGNVGDGPANFVRAQETGSITLAGFDFEADGQDFTPSGD